MQTTNESKSGTIEKRKFNIDPDFIDPLLEALKEKGNMDQFDEIEVEEIPHYYGIHLGIPINNEQ